MIDLGREMSTDNPLLHEVEMKSSVQHSVHPKAEMYCDIRNCSPEEAHVKRQEYLAQIPIPWVAEKTLFNPGFLKSDGKIVKYDSKGLAIWRALVSSSHTIISDSDTWLHLNALTIICFATMAIVILTDSYRSTEDNNSVVNRIQLLISFVFASYITIVINRWDRIRNGTVGTLWGSLENLCMFTFNNLRENTEQNRRVSELLLRHCRLVFAVLFLSCQGDSNLTPLIEKGFLLEKEKVWLEAANVGTRPLIVVGWMTQFFEVLEKKMGKPLSESDRQYVFTQLTGVKGGVGATLGAIGSQLPYPYVHIVYWTIQILLTSLSIETGVVLATSLFFMKNGNGEYSPADDTVTWPVNSHIWYANKFLQITASNVIFALFSEGMLKICDKLSNPLSMEDTSFSESCFDAFLYNNCRALYAGNHSYYDIHYDEFDAPKDAKDTKKTK